MKKVVALFLTGLLTLTACAGGGKKEYVGTYMSTSPNSQTFVQLKDDRTAYYQQVSSNRRLTGDTTWEIRDGLVVVHAGDHHDYDIYAETGDPAALLFKADSSRWNEYIWVKQGPAG